MDDVLKTKPSTLPLVSDVIKELVETKEKVPTPPKKIRVLPWLILGLVISFILAGIGALIWKWIQLAKQPDLTINAPATVSPSITPPLTPTGETTTLIPQEVLFEPKPYKNELAKFEINIPLGWQVDDTGKSNAILVMIDPKTTMASGSAILSLISVSTATSNNTLENEVKIIREGFLSTYASYVVKEDKEMLLNGKTYHLLGGSYLAKGTEMRNRTLIYINNKRGYAISAAAPQSVWAKKEIQINAAVFSFKPL